MPIFCLAFMVNLGTFSFCLPGASSGRWAVSMAPVTSSATHFGIQAFRRFLQVEMEPKLQWLADEMMHVELPEGRTNRFFDDFLLPEVGPFWCCWFLTAWHFAEVQSETWVPSGTFLLMPRYLLFPLLLPLCEQPQTLPDAQTYLQVQPGNRK